MQQLASRRLTSIRCKSIGIQFRHHLGTNRSPACQKPSPAFPHRSSRPRECPTRSLVIPVLLTSHIPSKTIAGRNHPAPCLFIHIHSSGIVMIHRLPAHPGAPSAILVVNLIQKWLEPICQSNIFKHFNLYLFFNGSPPLFWLRQVNQLLLSFSFPQHDLWDGLVGSNK